MRRYLKFSIVYLASAAWLPSAAAATRIIDDAALELNVIAGLRVPHHKRQIIEGPGGYRLDVLKHLAGISPYFDSPGVQLNPTPPDGCSVTKATYIVRHSNIYANDFDYETYLSPFLSKIGNFLNRSLFTMTPELAFLANYTSPITNATQQIERMTPSGGEAAAAFAGVIRNLYPTLLNGSASQADAFRIWAASASRDVDTANAFIQGLGNNATLVVVNEGENDSADSLTPHISCPAFDASMGSVQFGAWQTKYTAPLIERFDRVAPGFNFTLTDIVAMQQLCGYDTVIRNRTEFCDVFTADEWLTLDCRGPAYSGRILVAIYSYGNPIAPQLGLPWVRSALDILSANDTKTFNQTLYISFTHREEPPLVLTALGLFNNSAPYPDLDVNSTMPTDSINYQRAWRTSDILPFLGHVGIERMQCVNASLESTTTSGDHGAQDLLNNGTFVRVLVNGAPIPIPPCQGGPGVSCALGNFADYIAGRVALYGDFIGACGINSTVANRTDLLSIYNAQ